ncbi:recombinase RmuC [Erwinia sp. OLTSP20]|uniref:DNA recombination protein RmuC n=1 Tax=unclassified Erwinia TaxID=2622719 RepID=UPI000C196201|nr:MULTISPECIES: DNA recombination protein RmuC [unclassified Erwinia]PIJ50802.1 recombinase RmuC [Erwinia sp. OAMSP11]PIJ72954.1 recombinase RmuC [Erwinia sp. OLSSP12]PIJ81969.1 recombinase RmuC [Erwinia sp. OLCASP19]PIJ84624.1 recombinase RmuC [Erwinia sp. OLMTSP26]PIJ86972.1 recombinase RmuC [Erwinia sp. OLMDSP33]
MDITVIYMIAAGLTGLVAGVLVIYLYYQRRLAQLQSEQRVLAHSAQLSEAERQRLLQLYEAQQLELRQIHAALSAAQEKLHHADHWRNECEQLSRELRNQLEVNSAQEAELREVTIRLEETRLAAEEKQRLLVNSEQRLNAQFENLAHRIFENSGRRVDEQNRQSLNALITPLREQLEGFRRQVQEGFGQEARERHTLTHEIRQLQQLNARMAEEAVNLTRALKGDNKTQGNWGEVILNRVLEASGLREGYEYDTQVAIQLENQGRMQPDVIVHLPQNKDVVIDAKMTLVAYERYFNAQDDATRELAMSEHVTAIRSHLRQLSRKDYHRLPGVRSLDYVLMFIPVEPAFLLALDRQPELINEALQQNIMLVSPTTLLVALRTISNLWRYEHQSRNAQQIAERASRLYDKMRLFVDDMSAIGQNLDRASDSYRLAMKKLSEGRGNLIAQSERFRQLGVEIKRPIDPRLAQQAMPEEDAESLDETDEVASAPEALRRLQQ